MAHGTRKKSTLRWDRNSRESYWRQHVADCASSGLTVSEYCTAHGLSTERLYWWRRQLGHRAGRGGGVRIERPLFKEMHVPEPALCVSHRLEVVASGGLTVRVYPGFDAPTLQQVLSVLAGRSC